MGYHTDFSGSFELNKKLDKKTLEFLRKFNRTRRMARKLPKKYGVEGEFYVDGEGFAGQNREDNIIDYNTPPKTQPGLWCQWVPNEDGTEIVWDEGEKFYNYVEWLQYIVANFLEPKGYKISGTVKWYGEDRADQGQIVVQNNVIKIFTAKIVFEEESV